MDPVAAYRAARQRIAVLAPLDQEAQVPACPEWMARDLVAHLAGLAHDWVTSRLEEYASPAWTQRQVEERRRKPLAELFEEWERDAAKLEPILADPASSGLSDPLQTAFGPVPAVAWPSMIVTDLAAHEHDLRSALGSPGARHSDAVAIGWRSHLGTLRMLQAATGLPVLTITATDQDRSWAVGRGEPTTLLEADLFELFRASGGRRSRHQLESLAWSGDHAPWLNRLVLPSYRPPAEDLVE
jgi:uncharacterized protein (TIGR03083 family)